MQNFSIKAIKKHLYMYKNTYRGVVNTVPLYFVTACAITLSGSIKPCIVTYAYVAAYYVSANGSGVIIYYSADAVSHLARLSEVGM